jgi:hypothetical protein
MTLSPAIPRCPGQPRKVAPSEWPFPSQSPECFGCARRTQGIADYMAGADVAWMEAPNVTPCPERLGMKK